MKECPWCDKTFKGPTEQQAKQDRVKHMFAKHDDERGINWHDQLADFDD